MGFNSGFKGLMMQGVQEVHKGAKQMEAINELK